MSLILTRTEYCHLKAETAQSTRNLSSGGGREISITSFFLLTHMCCLPPGPCCLQVSGSFFLCEFPVYFGNPVACFCPLPSVFRVRGEVVGSSNRLSPRAELGRQPGFPAPCPTHTYHNLGTTSCSFSYSGSAGSTSA